MAKKPTNADAGRLARKAADFLEDRQWIQGRLEDSYRGGYCLSGALNKTYCGNAKLNRDRVDRIPLLNLTHELLDNFLSVGTFTAIEHWNDMICSSKEEAVQMLRKFADEYDPKKY